MYFFIQNVFKKKFLQYCYLSWFGLFQKYSYIFRNIFLVEIFGIDMYHKVLSEVVWHKVLTESFVGTFWQKFLSDDFPGNFFVRNLKNMRKWEVKWNYSCRWFPSNKFRGIFCQNLFPKKSDTLPENLPKFLSETFLRTKVTIINYLVHKARNFHLRLKIHRICKRMGIEKNKLERWNKWLDKNDFYMAKRKN